MVVSARSPAWHPCTHIQTHTDTITCMLCPIRICTMLCWHCKWYTVRVWDNYWRHESLTLTGNLRPLSQSLWWQTDSPAFLFWWWTTGSASGLNYAMTTNSNPNKDEWSTDRIKHDMTSCSFSKTTEKLP